VSSAPSHWNEKFDEGDHPRTGGRRLRPVRDRHLGTVALGHLGRVGLDLVAAIAAPHDQADARSIDLGRRPGLTDRLRLELVEDGTQGVDPARQGIAVVADYALQLGHQGALFVGVEFEGHHR
jgi:hypothetical protein